MNILKSVLKQLILFVFFGSLYFVIECVYKQNVTDIRMFLLGGIVSVLVGLINNLFDWDTSFILQCLVGTMIILLSEAILGYQWNIIEHRAIWDYSSLPLSAIAGQINLFFGVIWFILSGVCIVLDDVLRWKLFNEEKPRYQWF